MVNEDLTVDNFVDKIKQMGERERSEITSKILIELTLQVPDPVPVRTELAELRAAVEHITKIASVNRTEISSLKNKNDDLQKSNAALQAEITLLKVHAKECADHRRQPAPPPQQPHVQIPNDDLENLRTKVAEMEVELNSIQQYLRVNNLEIVGLPAPNDGESEESLLIHALNDLEGLTNRVTPQDIDISHPLPSKRKDGKSVHVVRFISRKTKFMILTAKKRDANKQFKFRNSDIFINEHLSKQNRSLFATAQEKKKALQYKYCWTKGGTIHMRKTDDSAVVTISSDADLINLA